MNKLRYLLLALPLLGAWLSRWHGGGWGIKAVKIAKNAAWSLPFGLVIGLLNPWLGALAFAGCFLKSTGHGRGLGLDEPMRADMEPEKIEYLIGWLEPSLTTHAYKHIIMAFTGVAGVLGAIIAFAFISPLAALIMLVSGLLKGLAYEIGLIIAPSQTKTLGFYKTEWGELITGFFAFGGLAVAYVVVQIF